jgi:hypothetical protein
MRFALTPEGSDHFSNEKKLEASRLESQKA